MNDFTGVSVVSHMYVRIAMCAANANKTMKTGLLSKRLSCAAIVLKGVPHGRIWDCPLSYCSLCFAHKTSNCAVQFPICLIVLLVIERRADPRFIRSNLNLPAVHELSLTS